MIQRPIPWEASDLSLDVDILPYHGSDSKWQWIGPLHTVDTSHNTHTIYHRECSLIIGPRDRYLGAYHQFADGKVFVRLYYVPTNISPNICITGKSQSLGVWSPTKSSLFMYEDIRS